MSADTLFVLGVRSLARLAGVPRSRVNAAMDAGLLVTVQTDGLRGRRCRYALTNGDGRVAFDAWASRAVGIVHLDDIQTPRTNGGRRWFYAGDIREAAAGGAFELRRESVMTPGPFLRWAASRMPAGERAAIVGAIVETARAEEPEVA